MNIDVERAALHLLARRYLSVTKPVPRVRTVEGACVTISPTRIYSWPADTSAYSILVEEPDAGWSARIEIGIRDSRVWRATVIQTWSESEADGALVQAQGAFQDWLAAL